MVDYSKAEKVIERIKEKIKKEVKKYEDKVIEIKNYLKREFEERVRKLEIDAEVFIGGSIEKGTWLPEKIEFDIFIRIKNPEHFKKFYEICPEGIRMLGSRDYFKFKFEGFWVEVVPIKYIETPEEAENVTDLSPFHVNYVTSRLNEEMKYDVRALKLFLKRRGIYGAETWISGFSGYMTELLIIKYGSILRLFKEVEERWRSKVYIDIEGYYRGMRDAIFNLGEDRTKGPMILVDPTFKYRNAAAALSPNSYYKFIFEVRKFLRIATEKEFLRETLPNVESLKKISKNRGTKLFIFETKIEGKEELFLGKVKRISRRIKERLENEGWSVYDYGFFKNGEKAYLYVELETIEKSKMKRHFGPPVWIKGSHFDDFFQKYKELYVFNERLATDIKRERIDKKIEEMVQEYGIRFKRVV